METKNYTTIEEMMKERDEIMNHKVWAIPGCNADGTYYLCIMRF